MSTPSKLIVEKVVVVAGQSPCAKSKRGCVIFCPDTGGILSAAFNGPPLGLACHGDEHCRAVCRKRCVHAETRALRRAIANFADGSGWRFVHRVHAIHAKVVNGELVTSGWPSCASCSGLLADADVPGMWLYHASGWTFYSALTFHLASVTHG